MTEGVKSSTKKKTNNTKSGKTTPVSAVKKTVKKTPVKKPTSKSSEELEIKESQDISEEVSSDMEEIKTEEPSDVMETEANVEEKSEEQSAEEQFDAEVLSEFEKISAESESNTTDTDLGLSKEVVDEKIKQALEYQSPKKRKRKLIVNLIFMLINIIFMVFIVKGLIGELQKTGVDINFKTVLKMQGDKLWWIGAGVLVYAIYILSQTLMYKVLIKDLTGKRRWGLSYDVAILGKYYDNVTPFAVGGQPMQIVRLAQNGISPGVSTSIPIIKMIMNNGINMLVAVLFFIFGLPRLPATGGLNDFLMVIIQILGVIGLVITVITVIFMFLISSGTLFTRTFVSGLLRIGYKLKIVKNYRQTFKKVINQLSEYKISMSYLWKHKKLLFKMIFLCLVECLTYASMPLFVMLAFSTNIDTTIWLFILTCFTRHYICTMASSYIPLPGGTGMMEISFIIVFGLAIGDNIVWALLFWRFLTYYVIILHGFVHELRSITTRIIKNGRKRKAL